MPAELRPGSLCVNFLRARWMCNKKTAHGLPLTAASSLSPYSAGSMRKIFTIMYELMRYIIPYGATVIQLIILFSYQKYFFLLV